MEKTDQGLLCGKTFPLRHQDVPHEVYIMRFATIPCNRPHERFPIIGVSAGKTEDGTTKNTAG